MNNYIIVRYTTAARVGSDMSYFYTLTELTMIRQLLQELPDLVCSVCKSFEMRLYEAKG